MIQRFTSKFVRTNTLGRAFSEVAKKPRMELTVRSPYKTFFNAETDFARVITRTDAAALVIQNNSPPATFVLPAGRLQVKN